MNDVKSTTYSYKIIVVLYSINMITYSMCLLHIDSIYYTGIIINTIMILHSLSM